MSHFKIPIYVLFLMISLLSVPNIEAVNYPEPGGHVNDYAGVMAVSAKRQLESALRVVKEQTGAEIAVVTVKDMGGLDVETYAVELMKKWGVGSKKLDDGILILVAMEERKWRIEVGYGLEPIITDAEAGQIGSSIMAPYLTKGDFSTGLTQGALYIASAIAEEKGVKLSVAPSRQVPDRRRSSNRGFPIINMIVIMVVILLFGGRRFGGGMLTGMLLGSMLGGGRRNYGGGGFGGGFGGSGGGGFGGFGGGFSGGGGASGGF